MTKLTGVGVGEGEGEGVTDPRGVGDTTDGTGVGLLLVELLLQPPVAMTLKTNTIAALPTIARMAVAQKEGACIVFILRAFSTAGDQPLRFLAHRVVTHLAVNRVANRSRPVDEERAR